MAQPSIDKKNARTGLVLAGIALAFFAGVMLEVLFLK